MPGEQSTDLPEGRNYELNDKSEITQNSAQKDKEMEIIKEQKRDMEGKPDSLNKAPEGKGKKIEEEAVFEE